MRVSLNGRPHGIGQVVRRHLLPASKQADVLDDVADVYAAVAEDAGHKLVWADGRWKPAVVRGDRELMEYAVYNLLTNAVKYSPVETRVSVRSEVANGFLRLSVRDQGIGMDENVTLLAAGMLVMITAHLMREWEDRPRAWRGR